MRICFCVRTNLTLTHAHKLCDFTAGIRFLCLLKISMNMLIFWEYCKERNCSKGFGRLELCFMGAVRTAKSFCRSLNASVLAQAIISALSLVLVLKRI